MNFKKLIFQSCFCLFTFIPFCIFALYFPLYYYMAQYVALIGMIIFGYLTLTQSEAFTS